MEELTHRIRQRSFTCTRDTLKQYKLCRSKACKHQADNLFFVEQPHSRTTEVSKRRTKLLKRIILGIIGSDIIFVLLVNSIQTVEADRHTHQGFFFFVLLFQGIYVIFVIVVEDSVQLIHGDGGLPNLQGENSFLFFGELHHVLVQDSHFFQQILVGDSSLALAYDFTNPKIDKVNQATQNP